MVLTRIRCRSGSDRCGRCASRSAGWDSAACVRKRYIVDQCVVVERGQGSDPCSTVTPIWPVESALRPYRQIGDPTKCAWCGGRAQSGFELYDPAGWVFCLGVADGRFAARKRESPKPDWPASAPGRPALRASNSRRIISGAGGSGRHGALSDRVRLARRFSLRGAET